MGLKQSLVIVNEYTIRNKSGKGGSRGGTPGEYVLTYMLRKGATEDLTPVRFDSEPYIQRYMLRKEAVESTDTVPEAKKEMREIQGIGGIAFGYGSVSLSDRAVRRASKDIQKQFDSGKTVLKTVISFDEEYLKKNHIVDPDFQCRNEGDYRGNIDQMKLRMAIMNGLDKMSKDYDDLHYIGCIQVDTKHVHCHLAMVDKGRGNIARDGTQKGKLSERSKRKLRRGIDSFLDENQYVRMMTSNITMDKRNALCFIKKQTHELMAERGLPQFLISCLPDNRNLWRAGTNAKEMRKANAIVQEFVMETLSEPNSGYRGAMRDVDAYAVYRQQREGLSDDEYMRLRSNGQKRIIEDCMNGVYAVLKQIPKEEMRVQTPMLSVMGMDYEDLASEMEDDPMMQFGFRLRSYSSRLKHHKEETKKYHDAVRAYEASDNSSDASKPLYDFFKFEEEYNAKLMCKYQYFLGFLPPRDDYEEDFDNLMAYKGLVDNAKKLRQDPSPKRMSADNAEDYGMRVYGVRGGRYMTFNPTIFDNRISAMEDRYKEQEDAFRFKLAGYGLTFKNDKVTKDKPFAFDDVKALDLHHLRYDFKYDFLISKLNVDEFVATADKRVMLFEGAKDYLLRSDQSGSLQFLPVSDVGKMKEMADLIRSNPTMPVVKPVAGGKYRSGRTVRLDKDYSVEMKSVVHEVLKNTRQLGD